MKKNKLKIKMIKNIYVIIIVSSFFMSCSQNKNETKDQDISTTLSEEIVSIDSNTISDEITTNIKSNTDNILRVFPENLKVDGYQTYFLNDTLFTGYSCHYENDIMIFEIEFKNGKKNGTSKFWFNNGKKKNFQTFKNGKAEGPFQIWNKEGDIIKEGVF